MSIEDVQKVNKLAQELLNQKIVSSRDEAVRRAQQMLNKEIAGNNVASQAAAKPVAFDDSNLKSLIERLKDNTDKQFAAYKNALIALEKEINSLKSKIAELSAKRESVAVQNAQQAAASQEQQKPAAQSKPPHPRMGNYKPEQVAIEKMFYYGH
jgi:SMC interacting uncharacterized protein involved in chromosome segregation